MVYDVFVYVCVCMYKQQIYYYNIYINKYKHNYFDRSTSLNQNHLLIKERKKKNLKVIHIRRYIHITRP